VGFQIWGVCEDGDEGYLVARTGERRLCDGASVAVPGYVVEYQGIAALLSHVEISISNIKIIDDEGIEDAIC